MQTELFETTRIKPFLKWAGGKKQLLEEISSRVPRRLKTGEITSYVEPFIGGGAVFFSFLQQYTSLSKFYLCDINHDLIKCYQNLQLNIEAVISHLKSIQADYFSLTQEEQKNYYLETRENFNEEKLAHFTSETAAKFIFLNRTCYNGLYRVNKKGKFNVPFGYYKNPRICDESNLRAVSKILKNTILLEGDFQVTEKFIDDSTFVYLDPPYRPISNTSNFTTYTKENFTQQDQKRLAKFCYNISNKGARFLLSNSDPKNEKESDDFFETHYSRFNIERVKAARVINCKSRNRGKINELIITNY